MKRYIGESPYEARSTHCFGIIAISIQLHAKFPNFDAVLPKKQAFGNLNPQFVKERQLSLQKYIEHLMWNKDVADSEEFRLFLLPVRGNNRLCPAA